MKTLSDPDIRPIRPVGAVDFDPAAATMDAEIAWVQELVDRIVENEPMRRVPEALSQPVAGAAGVLEMDALGRAVAGAGATDACDVLIGILFSKSGDESDDTILIGTRTITDGAGNPVVIDWRSPVGERFFQCSVEDPKGVVVRRRVRSRGTRVLGLDDEHLMSDLAPPRPLVGEAALLADPVEADSAMAPVVATLRSDQDRAVRARRLGDTVVVGPPGTGKTVVALNRASYLDFLRSDNMFGRHPAVYLVPTPGFAGFVSGVLPALGDASTRLAPMGEFLGGLARRVIGDDTPALAEQLGMKNASELGSGALRRRWRNANRRSARGNAGAVRSRNGLIALRRQQAIDLVEEATTYGSWASSRQWLRRTLLATAKRDHPDTRADDRREAAEEVVNRLLPRVRLSRIVAEVIELKDRETPGHRGRADSSATLGALLMLFVEQNGAEALRKRISPRVITADSSADGAPFDPDGESDFGSDPDGDEDEDISVGQLAGALVDTAAFDDHHRELWAGQVAADPWAFDHLIIDECQDQAPEMFRALRAAYPSAGRTFVGDLAQSGEPRWYKDMDDLRRAAGIKDPITVELSHNYRNDRSISDQVSELGTRIDGALRIVPVRPQSGELHLHPIAPDAFDLAGVLGAAGRRDPEPLWIGDASKPVPDGFIAASEVKGQEFSDVVIVVDPDAAPGEAIMRSLYVAVSRAMHRCHLYADPRVLSATSATSDG